MQLFRLPIGALLTFLVTGINAQAQYTVNVAAENTFAEEEKSALGSRPTPVAVPHLNPATVVNAMKNSNYLPAGSTPFTFVIAHRGSHTAPGCAENSACAIAAAYEAGADAIELDIKITQDSGPVLGHDVAVARELNNWVNSSGQNVTRSSWTPFSGFPILDYTYLDLTKYPFLNNFSLGVDPLNPTRSTMNVSDIQNGVLVDTYNAITGNRQLTLYGALYLVQKYYPMAIWLDVKSADDLSAIAPVITVARQQLGNSGPLANICLKTSYGTIADPTVNGSPANKMGLSAIYYFLVMGTGDLDKMAVYGGQSTPTSATQANSQAYITFQQLCSSANGCLGAELSHKYPNAPTQSMYTSIKQAGLVQLAGFHTVPQYSWYWQTLASQKQRATTYGRTFPRTDGSCCFALTDALNVSQYIGAESQDLRALFSWNEASFSTITTDEPLTVLRDLYGQGKRSIAIAQQIGGTNTSIPSGGSLFDKGVFSDGAYYIQTSSGEYNLTVSGFGTNVSLVPTAAGQPTAAQMWYLGAKSGSRYTITNAATGLSTAIPENQGIGSLVLGQANSSPGYLWSVYYRYGPAYTIQTDLTSIYNKRLSYNGSTVVLVEVENTWNLVPVSTPSSEIAQQQEAPVGYTYCADGDLSPAQTCNFTGQGSVAYGANGSFRYLQYTSGPVTCQLSSFNNIDPHHGFAKPAITHHTTVHGVCPRTSPIWRAKAHPSPITVGGQSPTERSIRRRAPYTHIRRSRPEVLRAGLQCSVVIPPHTLLRLAPLLQLPVSRDQTTTTATVRAKAKIACFPARERSPMAPAASSPIRPSPMGSIAAWIPLGWTRHRMY